MRYAKEIYLLSTHSSNVVYILLFFLWNERLLSHLVIAPLVCSRTQAHLSIPKWGASWGKKWLIFSRDLDSDPVFVPRIDDTESVEKSLLHTEANFYDFLTAGAGLVRFFADFKQKNLWKMKIRIEKNVI